MNKSSDSMTQTRQAVKDASHLLLDTKVIKTLQQGHEHLQSALKEQQHELKLLRKEVRRSRSGGFPWGLVLLAGAGYALYRSNPDVRQRIDGLLKQVNPGVQGNLARAGEAAKDAVSDLAQGQSPAANLHRVGGELGRAGEKKMDQVQDSAAKLQADARRAADDVRSDLKGEAKL